MGQVNVNPGGSGGSSFGSGMLVGVIVIVLVVAVVIVLFFGLRTGGGNAPSGSGGLPVPSVPIPSRVP